jgi:hypothetical protein
MAVFLPWTSRFEEIKSPLKNHGKFFAIAEFNGRLMLKSPDDKPFFSIGLNHIDPTPLFYPENHHIWIDSYENSQEKWLQSVSSNLTEWGFNTVGWVQEVINRGNTTNRHSRNFMFEEYQWLDMPYCHMLPFADFHQWDAVNINPDFFTTEFEDWCDYIAREYCSRMKNDPNLIGYFYIDCPTWLHNREQNQWKGPLFDGEKLKTPGGSEELFKLATRYYSVTHDSIRRYDKNHLILGDRYEANAPLPEEVVMAAKPYIDVLSFQHFGDVKAIKENMEYWHDVSRLPVLIADSARPLRLADGNVIHNTDVYQEVYEMMKDVTSCIGFHLCGGYIRNRVRRRGLLNEKNAPYTQVVDEITKVNMDMLKWAGSYGNRY